MPNHDLYFELCSVALQGPVHFTSQDGNERYLAGARKWSIDDIAGNCAVKVERKLPLLASPFGTMRQSQILIGSSSPDGTVQQIPMGVYNDNNQGIDCQYETACPPMNGVNQLGGVMTNAVGSGSMTRSVMVGGTFVTSPGQGRQGPQINEIPLEPHPLMPEQWKADDCGVRGASDEWYRLRVTNGKKADSWFGLKEAALFARSLFSGRTGSGK